MDLTEDRYATAYATGWRTVYRAALAWTNDAAVAEDLAQEAFLRLWDRRASIDWDGAVLAWLLVTVRHLATDHWRRLRVALRVGRRPVPAAWTEALAVEWLDVRNDLQVLRPAERVALLLTVVEGLSSDEVGQALGVSGGAARAAVSRARAALRERQ